MTIKEIAFQIEKRSNEKKAQSFLVAVDGHGGSGKSTFVNKLKKYFTNKGITVQVVELDGFIATEHDTDWKALKHYPESKTPYKINMTRLRKEVLVPLSKGKLATYIFLKDWWDKNAKLEKTVIPEGIIFIEGCYSLSEELRGYYDYKIYIDCPYEIRLQRVSERDISFGGDSITAPLFWEEIYFPAELNYMEKEKPKDNADIVIKDSSDLEI